jgi:catechol 2,3-dioxygenase-like lactoylglutathione lyase family enzyme
VIQQRTGGQGVGMRRGDFLRRTAIAGAGVAGGATLGAGAALSGVKRPGRESTLRDRINRVAYVVINVSDLERSRAFYESVSPLQVRVRTQAPAQRFAGLGIARGQFDGYLMDDGSGGAGGPPTQIHLVQWMTPAPVGQPYPVFWHVGLAKIAFTTPSAKAKLAQLASLGIHTTNRLIYRGYTSIQDPDGVGISFPGSPTAELPAGEDPRRYERLLHTNPSVRDIARSMRFYGEFMGLDLAIENVPCEPIASSQGPGSDLVQWDSHLYTARGGGFLVDASQFHYPPPTKATLTPYVEPTNLGIARIGFEVDDIDAAYEILVRARPVGKGPAPVGPPEEWDYGPPRGVRRVVVFRDPDGIRLELTEKIPLTPTDTCTQPVNPPPLPGV